MPGNSKAFLEARNYLYRELPLKLSMCQAPALAYGTCVSEWDNLRKNDCKKEFLALKDCIKRAKVK